MCYRSPAKHGLPCSPGEKKVSATGFLTMMLVLHIINKPTPVKCYSTTVLMLQDGHKEVLTRE